MAKLITKWWWVIAGLLLGAMYVYGYQRMYFHQDDLDWFILANRPLIDVLRAPIGDHVNYVWRLLLKVEWDLFGMTFPWYLAVSLTIHASVVWLLYYLARATSGRADLSAMAALLFSVNTNWTETILWISGQTITITALFVLLSMIAIWQKKSEGIALLLASWTSALAIGVLGASALVYKKMRWQTLGVLVLLGIIYKQWATDGTSIAFSLEWLGQVGVVWGLMPVNSVIGRLLIPFDRLETVRIILVCLALFYGAWKWRDKLLGIWRDEWSRFLLLHLGIYNLIVAVGRAQYGVGIMRAERYTYLGLLLVLLLAVRVMRNVKIGRWAWIVPMIVVSQCIGFYHRAEGYIERPQQLKKLVQEIKQTDPTAINQGAYLPHFVLNDERLKYRDLLPLLKD